MSQGLLRNSFWFVVKDLKTETCCTSSTIKLTSLSVIYISYIHILDTQWQEANIIFRKWKIHMLLIVREKKGAIWQLTKNCGH